MLLVNTPYDDVFKTLSHDCSELLIPVVNDVFHEHFIGNEKIIFYPNEHFINQQNYTQFHAGSYGHSCRRTDLSHCRY